MRSASIGQSVVVVAPGQGSQTPGFLEPWLAEPRFAEHLGALADASGVDLVRHGTVSDADTIRDTAVAQPLIVAASLLAFGALAEKRDRLAGVAGPSVGEFAAAAAAGVFILLWVVGGVWLAWLARQAL